MPMTHVTQPLKRNLSSATDWRGTFDITRSDTTSESESVRVDRASQAKGLSQPTKIVGTHTRTRDDSLTYRPPIALAEPLPPSSTVSGKDLKRDRNQLAAN